MKRYTGVLLAAAAALALLAAVWFSQRNTPVVKPTGDIPDTVDRSVTTVSPETLPAASPSAPAPAAPGLQVKAAAAENLATGALLYGFHADERWPLASVTKIMTASIVTARMGQEQIITLMPADFAGGPEILTASLQPGERYRAQDLLKVLLVPSSNEAAEAFARTYGHDAFVAAMNSQALAWGLGATHFDDPSGLSAANQSTPREVLAMVRQVYLAHPEVFAVTRSPIALVEELNSGAMKQFSTTNNFAGREDFLGGKTGTTPQAGDNLVSIFSVHGEPIAFVVFGAADRYAATRSLLQLVQ